MVTMTPWLQEVSFKPRGNRGYYFHIRHFLSERQKLLLFIFSEGESSNYRPPYLDHFDKPALTKDKNEPTNVPSNEVSHLDQSNTDKSKLANLNTNILPNVISQEKAQEVLNRRLLEQISGGQIQEGPSRPQNLTSTTQDNNNTVTSNTGNVGDLSQGKFQRCIAEGDLDFVSR